MVLSVLQNVASHMSGQMHFADRNIHTTRSLSFPTFTIPKGLYKNILNGNVRLLIYEYLNM